MTVEELIRKIKEANLTLVDKEHCPCVDREEVHGKADALLLKYINDKRVDAAFDAVDKWYA